MKKPYFLVLLKTPLWTDSSPTMVNRKLDVSFIRAHDQPVSCEHCRLLVTFANSLDPDQDSLIWIQIASH